MAEIEKTISSFSLVGRIKLNKSDEKKNSFRLNQTNKAGTWMSSFMSFGVDCGTECGVVYASCQDGHSLTSDSYKNFYKRDETGKASEQITVQYSEKDTFDTEQLNSYDGYTLGLKSSADQKTLDHHRFVFGEDFIQAVYDNINDGDVVRVQGTLSYYRNPENGEVTINKNINKIMLSTVTEDKFNATFYMQALIDSETVGQPNKKDKVYPLYVKVCDYVGKVGNKVYKQMGCYSIKILYDYSDINQEDEAGKKRLYNIIKYGFSVEKKDSVDLITIEGKFIEGTPVKEIKIEDYPMDTQKMYSLGLISEEQLKGIAATGNREKNMYFTTFVMDPTEKGVKREKNKYKKSDIVMIQDLEPKEILEEPTNIVNKKNDDLSNIAIETNEDEEAEFYANLFNSLDED